jgi:YbbR domain-containing protein
MEALAFFDVYANATTTGIAIGNVTPSSSDDTQLRVYNTSDLYQAHEVTVTIDGPNDGQLYLSVDGDEFTASIDIGDIPPGAYSSTFTMRRVTNRMTQDQDYTATLVATPTAWTDPAGANASNNVPLDTSDN